MTCANKTCSSVFTIPAPTSVYRSRPTFMKAMIAIVEAFQETLDMRRAAQRSYPLNDE
jgi:hypothetical protein